MKTFSNYLTEELKFFQNGADKISSNKWRFNYKSETIASMRVLYIPSIRKVVFFDAAYLHETAVVKLAVHGLNGKQIISDDEYIPAGFVMMVKFENKKEYEVSFDHSYLVHRLERPNGNISAYTVMRSDSKISSSHVSDIKKQCFALINFSDVETKIIPDVELIIKTKGYLSAYQKAVAREYNA